MMVNDIYVIQALKLSAPQAFWQKPSMIGSKAFLSDALNTKECWLWNAPMAIRIFVWSNLKKDSGSKHLQVEIGLKYIYTGSMHAAAFHQQL